jgi:transposase
MHFVAVPIDRDEKPVRCFKSFTEDLVALADWLSDCGIDTVAMEATGVYWIPLFELLVERGFEVKLVNPHHLKNVPGRKTDVADCQWIQQLHTFGLLAGAFRPDEDIVQLRTLMRHRGMLVSCAAEHVQHIQKALSQMNVKLQHVVSDTTGVTALRIIRAILGGERDPVALANFRDKRCKNSKATIAKSLHGNWRDDHLFELRQAMELYDVYQQKLVECDKAIATKLEEFPDVTDGRPLPSSPRKPPRKNQLRFEAREPLYRMTGVDLTRIEGIDRATALLVISEIGTNVQAWPSAKHFASWLCLCPGNKVSGGKRLGGRTRHSANRVATALRLAARSLHHSKSALGAFFRRKKAHLGVPKAITATAHKLARMIYSILRYGNEYVDAGAEYYDSMYHAKVLRHLSRRARELGYELSKNTNLPPDCPQNPS